MLAPPTAGSRQQGAERAMQRYGSGRISQVMLTAEWYRDHMPRYKAALEDGLFLLPRSADVLVGSPYLDVLIGRGGADQIDGAGGTDTLVSDFSDSDVDPATRRLVVNTSTVCVSRGTGYSDPIRSTWNTVG